MENKLKNDPRYQNHESRPDLAGEHPQGDRLQLLAFILFIIASLFDHLFLGWAAYLRSLFPLGARLSLSLAIIFLGGYMSFSGIQYIFSEYTEEPRMYTTGLFSYIRHPVYLGALIVYIGLLFVILSPLALMVFIGVFLLYNWLAQDEEERMLNLFGARYQEYMRQIPRWFPKLQKQKRRIQ